MKITNRLDLPEGLVRAVSTERHNRDGCVSATTLLQGTKQILLTERHWDELEDDAAERVWAVFGTAVHSLLESEGENEFAEIDVESKVLNTTVTGRVDNYNMATGTICDYKTASTYKILTGSFDDWRAQGLTYAWLLRRNGLPAARCRFIAMLKDHSKREARRSRDYPQKPIHVYEFDVTDEMIEDTERSVYRKVAEIEAYRRKKDDDIPPCSERERWSRKTEYAVKKNGRKTAVRVLGSEDEATEYAARLGAGHYVETRHGEPVRCLGYCTCAPFCDYYRNNVTETPKAA